MNCLLLVAHGSRRAESNEEIRTLTDKVARLTDQSYDKVECAYLELAEPLIPDAIKSLTETGAKSIMVVPYFLARGAHVASDIPEQISISREANPEVEITVSDYLGAAPNVPEMIIDLAKNASKPKTV